GQGDPDAEPRTRLIRNVSPRACIPDRLTIVTTGEFFNRIGPIVAIPVCAQMRSLCRTIANPETCHSDVPMSAAGHTRPD
ncbi:hypothetical protein, partial [Sphingorhabdus sp.]|uniref:hypothetical protein n=1 Tax=Sphingorhabdus sp. TaxID=1902408 RepID=UPI0037C7226C